MITVSKQVSINQQMTFADMEFPSFDDFARFHLSQQFSCHYEIIKGIQSAYFDIDSPNVSTNDVLSREDFLDNVISLVKAYFGKMTSKMAILVFSSSDTKKTSYHVLVKGVHFSDHIGCGYHAKGCCGNVDGFDQVVYTSVRKFRLLFSRKLDSTRIKQLTKVINEGYYSDAETSALNDDRLFALRESFVSIVDQKRSILIEHTEVMPARRVVNRQNAFDVDHVKNALRLLEDMFPRVYAKRDLACGDSILNLDRLRAYKCDLCGGKLHEAEGAFIVRRGNSYAFYCRRNTDGECLILEDDDDGEIMVPVVPTEVADTRNDLLERLLEKCKRECTFKQPIPRAPTSIPYFNFE